MFLSTKAGDAVNFTDLVGDGVLQCPVSLWFHQAVPPVQRATDGGGNARKKQSTTISVILLTTNRPAVHSHTAPASRPAQNCRVHYSGHEWKVDGMQE